MNSQQAARCNVPEGVAERATISLSRNPGAELAALAQGSFDASCNCLHREGFHQDLDTGPAAETFVVLAVSRQIEERNIAGFRSNRDRLAGFHAELEIE